MAKKEKLDQVPTEVVSSKTLFYKERVKSSNPQEMYTTMSHGMFKEMPQETPLKLYNDFFNGFFYKDKGNDVPYPIGYRRNENKVVIEIALAGFVKESFYLSRFENILTLSVSSNSAKILSSDGNLKSSGFNMGWRLPPRTHKVESFFENGILRIFIYFDAEYDVRPPEQIPINS
jgi:HSP20 family molecular chaperone IbpA